MRTSMKRGLSLGFFLSLGLAAWAGAPAAEPVGLAPDCVVSGGAPEAERPALIAAIRGLLEDWIRMDSAAYLARLAPDVTILSPQLGRLEQGRDAVAAALPEEWKAYERRGGRLSLSMKLRSVRLEVAGDTATALLLVDLAGRRSLRWPFEDRWLLLQAFARAEGRWSLVHQQAATDLDEAVDQASGFRFDFAYPVRDLGRAVEFYEPILGKPSRVDAEGAVFEMGGPRFRLDAGELGGLATVRPGLPNGYGIVYVKDLRSSVEAARAAGAAVLRESSAYGPDLQAVVQDPGGNVLALREERFLVAESGAAPALELASAPGAEAAWLEKVRALELAWLRQDRAALAAALPPGALWLEDAFEPGRPPAEGREAALLGMERDWSRCDRTASGLALEAHVDGLRVRPFGSGAIVSYQRRLVGLGPHPISIRSLVTRLWTAEGLAATLAARSGNPAASLAQSLDYTGYPTPRLKASERFYTKTLALGEPYSDEDYFGWWGLNAVFGTYVANLEDDGFPVPGRSNGYASFWVDSANKTHAYLRQHGSAFPLLPSINDHAGVDAQPGYVQVLATDSEGNVVLFTEYPGQ